MRTAAGLTPRWFARPRLALAAAAAAVLLVAAEGDRRATQAAAATDSLIVAQAIDPDPQRRQRIGADALALARSRPEVAAARLVPPDDLIEWARAAGAAPLPDGLVLPTTVEIRLARADARARMVARLRRLPGLAVEGGDAPPAPGHAWLLEGLATAALLMLAAQREALPLRSAATVLAQLGATPRQRIGAVVLAVGGSGGAGAILGGFAAAVARWPGGGWSDPVRAVLATTGLLVAALLPCLRGEKARRP